MELSLKEFMTMIRRKLWLVLLIVIVISGLTAMYQKLYVSPVYEASVKLVVSKERVVGPGLTELDMAAVNTNIRLINSYIELVRTTFILDEAAKRLPELGLKGKDLLQRVGANAAMDTQVMSIYALADNYAQAASIVNTVSQVFKEKIPEVFSIDNVTILNTADPNAPEAAVNDRGVLSVIVAFFASLILGLVTALLLEFMNDKVRTEEDALRMFGQPVLGVIAKVKKSDFSKRAKPRMRGTNHAVPS